MNVEFYCSVWNDEKGKLEEGQHEKVDEIVLKDAYFVAYDISKHMPENQRVDERDVEMVDFRIDISGDEITEDDVSSRSSEYLEKFPGVYEGVAGYVENLDRVPAEQFQCPKCSNYLASGKDMEEHI
jgi:hypothetical protein